MKDDGKHALQLVRQLVRVGVVNSRTGGVHVRFPDRDNMICGPLQVCRDVTSPAVGDTVLCIFSGVSLSDGFIVGVL